MITCKKTVIFFVILSLILISFSLGYIAKEVQIKRYHSQPEQVDFSLLWEAYYLLERNFVNIGEINPKDLVHGAISGMLYSLGDPHTVFFNPKDTERFLEDAGGFFEGIGMEVGLKEDLITVISPIKGTPAYRAGLLSGDVILKIDGKSIEGLSIDQAVNLIRGPKDTIVVLEIVREGQEERKEFAIKRDVIELPSLEWEIVDNIAHIKFYHFYKKADDDFKVIAHEILNSPVEGIILDLRNNSGGYLEVAEEIGGWLFEKETLLLIEDYGNSQIERKTNGSGRISQYPTVVIINSGSASASEILAGALRDQRDVPIIGIKSFGKGSIQRLEYLTDGSSLKITIANWLTPKGDLISEKGLDPDFEVEEDDDQLKKAIEVLKEII